MTKATEKSKKTEKNVSAKVEKKLGHTAKQRTGKVKTRFGK